MNGILFGPVFFLVFLGERNQVVLGQAANFQRFLLDIDLVDVVIAERAKSRR